MRAFRLISLLLILLAALGGAASAQEDGGITRVEIVEVVAEDLPQITLLVNVVDPYGVPVSGLGAEAFNITVDGQPATITAIENVTQDNLPISVVLVIDTSESMLGLPLAAAQDAARAFLDRLRPGDQVALMEFDSTVRLLQDFTTDFDALRAAIDSLVADGRTALYQAAYDAAQLATQAGTPRRYVVLLTDGNEYGRLSAAGPQEAIELAAANNIAFYTFGLGFGVERAYLEPLAAQTRGEALFSPTPDTLAEQYGFLAAYLRTQYVITLTSEVEPDGAEHTLEVRVNGVADSQPFTAPDFYPQIAFEGVPEGEIAEPVTITAHVTAPRGLGAITASIDGAPLDLSAGPPVDNTVAAALTIDPYTLTPGAHTLTVEAEDALGGARALDAALTVAALPPVVTIEGLDDGAFLEEGAVEIAITPERSQQPIDRVTIAVDGQPVEEFAAPPYAATLDLMPFGPGAHSLSVEVDSGGAATRFTRGYTLDPRLFITPSPTPTNTPTFTPTFTPSHTPTVTPSATPTTTNTPAPTSTPTPPPTDTPDRPGTLVAQALIMTTTAESWTATPEPATNTPAPTRTPRPTNTPAPTRTASPEPTSTPRPSDTPAPTSTASPEPTDTPEPTSTATATPTNTPQPTDTVTPSPTPDLTSTAAIAMTQTAESWTDTPVPSDTPDASATALQVALAMTSTAESWTATPTNTATRTVTPSPTVTDTAQPSDTPEPSATPTEAPTDTPEPSDTPTPEPTDTPGPTRTPRPTATATPVPEIVEVGADDEGLGTTQIAMLCVGALALLGVLALFLSRVVGRGSR